MAARPPARFAVAVALLTLAACATRSADVQPLPVDEPGRFASWSCEQLADERDRVQRRAADVAYAVDRRAGNNIVALGLGLMVFWPALLAMQPDGAEAGELARLKGRDDALGDAARSQQCAPPPVAMPPARAAALPVARGDRLIYEERVAAPRQPSRELVVSIAALGRDGIDFALLAPDDDSARWRQDLAGNLSGSAPPGLLHWRRLLRPELSLGQVLEGDLVAADGDASVRARARGQVVAVGPQTIAGRAFDVAVIELFGEVVRGSISTRLDGVLAVDRSSGVLMRLELRSADPQFSLRRRLARIETSPS